MNLKFLATGALAAILACAGLTAAQAASVDAAYISANATILSGNAVSATLDGVQYQVKFSRRTIGFCVPHVQPNIGQPAMTSARVVNGLPLTVNVILADGNGNGFTGPDFYLTVVCLPNSP